MARAAAGTAPIVRLFGLAAARGAASALGFLGVALVARALPPAELGRWSLALAVAGFALHLGEFGLRSVVTTELHRAGAAWRHLLRRYLALRLALTVLTLALVLGATQLLRPESVLVIALASVASLATALQLDWIALVDDRRALAAATLIARPATFLLLLLLVARDSDVLTVGLCYLASWSVAAAVSWPSLRRPADAAARTGELPGAKRMLARGAPLMLVTLTNQAMLSADLLLAGWTLGLAEAGDYYLASQIAVAGLLFANAANQLALARLPALRHDPAAFAAALAGEARRLLALALLLAGALGLAGPWLLPYLFGGEHAGAIGPLAALLPWLVLQHLSQLIQGALAALGREREVWRANLGMLGTLAIALTGAATLETLTGFALARSLAEAARLWCLLGTLRRAGLRWW